ncbi:hypothetical protein PV326_013916 [Microctonus aethiopoides]|nr:hypothetical protein PV326_013916 [Microctonus aethiopoides]
MFFNCIKTTARCLQRVNQLNTNNTTPIIQMQKYCTWHHRQPVRIENEEEILKYAEEAAGPNEFIEEKKPIYKRAERLPLKVKPKTKQIKKKLQVTPEDFTHKQDGSLNITELKEDDRMLTTLMMSVRSRKQRDKNSRIILEGHRLITDAINSGAIPEIIVFSRKLDLERLILPEKGIKLFKVPYQTIRIWSTLVTPPGLMGFFKIPEVENQEPAHNALPLTIICDNVRDPGNLGSILRAAAAVGCKKLITLVGCVDLWEPKVLKSAAGCHFRMPIFASKTWEDIPKLIEPFANIYVADNSTIIDSVSDDAKNVTLNEEMNCESQTDDESIEDIKGLEEDSTDGLEEIEEEKIHIRKNTYHQRHLDSKIAKKITSNIPVIPYYSANYTENENIIIIGGETLGLSLEALDMVKEKYGVRLNIPMTNGVDSLNTSMALGIIAFEMRRQHAVAHRQEDE